MQSCIQWLQATPRLITRRHHHQGGKTTNSMRIRYQEPRFRGRRPKSHWILDRVPRVRFMTMLQEAFGQALLAKKGHCSSPLSSRLLYERLCQGDYSQSVDSTRGYQGSSHLLLLVIGQIESCPTWAVMSSAIIATTDGGQVGLVRRDCVVAL